MCVSSKNTPKETENPILCEYYGLLLSHLFLIRFSFSIFFPMHTIVYNIHISPSVCVGVCVRAHTRAAAQLRVAQYRSSPCLKLDDPHNPALPLWISPKAPAQRTKYPPASHFV